jgi:LuxR family maltose regulon positive regulatory protein
MPFGGPSTDPDKVTATPQYPSVVLIPPDCDRQWYRYHHLFADLLNARLRQTTAEQLRSRHRQALAWQEQMGWITESIRLAVAGQDWVRATRLVDQSVEFLAGQCAT